MSHKARQAACFWRQLQELSDTGGVRQSAGHMLPGAPWLLLEMGIKKKNPDERNRTDAFWRDDQERGNSSNKRASTRPQSTNQRPLKTAHMEMPWKKVSHKLYYKNKYFCIRLLESDTCINTPCKVGACLGEGRGTNLGFTCVVTHLKRT